MRTMTLDRWWTLPEWKRHYWAGYLDSVGWPHDQCFEFVHIGPVPVAAGIYRLNDEGKKYLEGDDVAREWMGWI